MIFSWEIKTLLKIRQVKHYNLRCRLKLLKEISAASKLKLRAWEVFAGRTNFCLS